MTENDEHSLISDEVRARIGVKVPGVSVTVGESDARRMRDILGDSNPDYADGGAVAPPYVLAVLDSNDGIRAVMPRVLPGMLLTQSEWSFRRPLRIGETLSTTYELADIRERLGGRYGHSVLVTCATSLYDQEGNLVAQASRMMTQFATEKQGGAEQK